MKSGKYAFSWPVALNIASSRRWMFSQIANPHGLITMQPRTSEFSARSAAFTTCWYHSGKFSTRVGVIADWGGLAIGEGAGCGMQGAGIRHSKNKCCKGADAFYGIETFARTASLRPHCAGCCCPFNTGLELPAIPLPPHPASSILPMPDRRYVCQLGHNEQVSQVFLASEKQLRPNRNG